MNAQQWYIVGAVLLAMGVTVLAVSQIVLGKWLKSFRE